MFALVGEREASNFHVLFSGDDYLELGLDAVIGATKHRALVGERHRVTFGFLGYGLRSPTRACRNDVAQVNEMAAGSVVRPPAAG